MDIAKLDFQSRPTQKMIEAILDRIPAHAWVSHVEETNEPGKVLIGISPGDIKEAKSYSILFELTRDAFTGALERVALTIFPEGLPDKTWEELIDSGKAVFTEPWVRNHYDGIVDARRHAKECDELFGDLAKG